MLGAWGAIAFLGYCFYAALDSIEGETTIARIGLALLAEVSMTLSIGFGIGGSSLAVVQAKLRKKVIERLTSRIQELETQLDARRSSSRLTPRGETRPEDRM